MTIKPIRWFETHNDFPAALHNTESPIVSLKYKDYDNYDVGVEPWFLPNKGVSVITLIHEFGDQPFWDWLKIGAQNMVYYAASNDLGFKDGNLYGIFRINMGISLNSVRVGLAYASLTNVITPVRSLVELSYRDDSDHVWLTPRFAIPLTVDIRLPVEDPEVFHRRSRYERPWVI